MTKPLQERIGGGVGGGEGRGGGDYAGFKGMGKSELGQKSKPGERGGAYFSFSFVQWNLDITKVLGITNDIFCPSYSIMYGKEPRYNQQNFRITAIRSLRRRWRFINGKKTRETECDCSLTLSSRSSLYTSSMSFPGP